MSVATLGNAIVRARSRKGLGQRGLASIINYSDKTVSAIETGYRSLPHGAASRLVAALDDPELITALQAEATGGIASPILDGESVDLHRSSVRDKVIEECSEVIKALAEARAMVNCKSGKDLNDEGKRQIAEVIHQGFEAITALWNLLAVLCSTYGISFTAAFKAHVKELKAKGLMK